ncbi:MAG: flagellar filament capping protein FliD [candidate division Zixibacteria bacterium]|nr:flagellar filament capping protein FliD [candidate division Zixibacteria bacterium]
MPSGSFTGMVSGLDTESIINAMLAYEARNELLINARKTEVTNKMTAWNSVSAYLLGFRNQASVLSKESAWNTKTIANSDDTVFTAEAKSNAVPGVYYVSVDSLAQQEQLASQGFDSTDSVIGEGTIVISVGEGAAKTLTIDSSNNTLEDLRDAINEADAGVSASIINDGSSANAYRLILTAEETGLENQINLEIDLTGGTTPDFTSSSFDTPETLTWNSNATSSPALGDTASYTGDENKTYTFTIQGSGEMTVGSGDIFIDWTDGTNSGTITVSSADTEVALAGAGSDGLKIKLAAGTVYGGDTFQVQTFSPVLQEATDSKISIGNTSGGGSPIQVTSSTNTVEDVIEGVTLNLLKVSDSGPNTVTVELDKQGMTKKVQGLVDQYNQLVDYLLEVTDYDPETEQAGMLIGESGIISLQSTVHRLMTNPISGLPDGLNRLMDLGVSTQTDGKLKLDASVLHEKIEDDLQGVIDFFRTSGSSTTELIEYISSTDDTVIDGTAYSVNITQAATKGTYTGTSIDDPAVNNLVIDDSNYKFKIRVNGVQSNDIELTRKTYTTGEELAEEMQKQINTDPELTVDVSVTWVDEGDTGYLKIESDNYGSSSKVEVLSSSSNSAVLDLGLKDGEKEDGQDVAGTINGEEAEGTGQLLRGKSDNETTEGLVLKITLTEDDINETTNEGSITLSRGLASHISYEINKYTDYYDGSISYRINAYEKQIEGYDKQLENLYARLEKRRESLMQEFYEMEQVLSRLQSQGNYFSSQISQLTALQSK